MDSIRNFFSQIDRRIFDLNLSNLTNSGYLLDNKPEGFYMQSWAYLIGFLGIELMVLIIIFLRKRRNRLHIEKGKRHILSLHFKINLGFFITYFLLVFFRSQGVPFLSMRLLSWICLFGIFISTISCGLRAIIYKSESKVEAEVKTEDAYHKYLPKKKKKK